MVVFQYPLVNATDLEAYPTLPTESVIESINSNLALFWNPIGASNNHWFQWLGDWGGTSYRVNGCALYFTAGAEPKHIKIYNNVSKTIELFNQSKPTYTSVMGSYSLLICKFNRIITLTELHIELQKDDGDPFNLNYVIPFYSPFRPLIKRSPTGRESFKFPGRQKPRWSSYQETPEVFYNVV